MPLFRSNREQRRDRAGRFARDIRGAHAGPVSPTTPDGATPPYAADEGVGRPAATFEALLEERLTAATADVDRELTVTKGWDGGERWVSFVTPTCRGSVYQAEAGTWRAIVVPAALTTALRAAGPFQTEAEACEWAERKTLDIHREQVRTRTIQDTLTELDSTAGA